MRRRQNSATPFSLFSFQDIITSVTGIMILVTLMVALELMSRTASSASFRTSQQIEDSRRSISDMKQEIERLRAQMASTDHSVLEDIPSFNEQSLRDIQHATARKLDTLRRENAKLEKTVVKRQAALAVLRRKESSNAAHDKKKKDLLAREARGLRKKIQALANSDQSFFVVGKGQRPTWIIELTSHSIVGAMIGRRQPPRRFVSIDSLEEWIRSQSPNKYGYFLVVKPSGVELFGRLKEFLLKGDFAFGFDVASAGKTIIDPQRGVSPP